MVERKPRECLPMTTNMPPIVLGDVDVARLELLAESRGAHPAAAAAQLRAELARARVVPTRKLPPDVVAMNASIACVDERTGTPRRLTLVYPHEADIARGRVSVLSPVGMALLGLRVGQSIEWPAPAGALRLTVTDVRRAATGPSP
jgi:regulator of nucleoside diphosphate kinase